MSERVNADLHGIEKTGRSRDGLSVLEVTLMVESSRNSSRTFTGWVYPQEVELKSDPDDLNLDPDELKEMMAGAAHRWDKEFGDWDAELTRHDSPVRD